MQVELRREPEVKEFWERDLQLDASEKLSWVGSILKRGFES